MSNYARLREADASGKVDVLFDVIEADADGRLGLPKRSCAFALSTRSPRDFPRNNS
jgi:hypothetical protein